MTTTLLLLGGLTALLLGGEALVYGAVGLARHWRVPPLIIGLTIVSIGTSAPELAVSLMATAGQHGDMALGNVINTLVSEKQGAHVPFRDSKLTKLLMDSLEGNAKTCILACIGPGRDHLDESLSTRQSVNITHKHTKRTLSQIFLKLTRTVSLRAKNIKNKKTAHKRRRRTPCCAR